jgi:hypothetical protein
MLRKDNEDPRASISSTDILDPALTLPNIDMDEPMRENERILNEDPIEV